MGVPVITLSTKKLLRHFEVVDPRKLAAELHVAWPHLARQGLPDVVPKGTGRRSLAVDDHTELDLGFAELCRDGNRRCLHHARKLQSCLFHIGGRDVRPAPTDLVAHATDQEEEALLVEPALVA